MNKAIILTDYEHKDLLNMIDKFENPIKEYLLNKPYKEDEFYELVHTLPPKQRPKVLTEMFIKSTYDHIVKYWKEEYYKKCRDEWEKVKQHMFDININTNTLTNTINNKSYKCPSCETCWSDVKMINYNYKICCECDTYVQPFLCNPKNKKYVMLYIPQKYHKYLI
jgi:hypothetical protein